MPKLVKREIILLKIETTQGTDAVPAAATDSLLVEDIGWSFAGARMVERNPVKGSLGRFQSVFAGTLMEMTFMAEIKGSGSAGVAPEIGPALRACGLLETIVATTSVEYEPASTGHESATIYYYEDGSLYKILGAFGTVNMNLPTGEIGKVEFTFTGHVVGPVDAALPTGVYDDVVPAPVINAPFSALGFSAIISALNLDVGNEIATPPSMSASDGYSDVLITDRDMAGSFNPEATTVAVKDFIGEWKSGATGAINSGNIGATAGNIYALSIPTGYYREVGPGDRDGLRTYEIGFAADGDDSAFSLLFT